MTWKRWYTVVTAVVATLVVGTMTGRLVWAGAVWFYDTDIRLAQLEDTNDIQDATDEKITEAIEGITDILEKQETDAEMKKRHDEFCLKHELTREQCADY